MKPARVLIAAVVAALALAAQAQQPPVYKCEKDGKVEYTDEPCLHAKTVDVTPTKGMETYDGATRKNTKAVLEKQKEEARDGMAKLVQSATGQPVDTFKQEAARARLPSADRQECARLDASLPVLERKVTEAGAGTEAVRQRAAESLLSARKRFKELKC